MTFPTVASSSAGNDPGTVGLSDHTVTLPATVTAGDLLIVVFTAGFNATVTWDNTTAGTWETALFDVLNGTSVLRYVGYWKTADGTEDGASLTISTSQTCLAAWHAFAISGWDGITAPAVTTVDHASSTGPDPGALDPSWNSEDTLFLATVGYEATGGSPTASGYPTNYTGGANNVASGTRGSGVASARREVNADWNTVGGEDPAAFTLSGAVVAITALIAVRPTADGGGGGISLAVVQHHRQRNF